MTNGSNRALTAKDVLRRYLDEGLAEFVGLPLDDVRQRGNFGDCPIHVAAVRGDVDELTALIEGGSDVNARGRDGLHTIAPSGLSGAW